jgi:hypothetical protein
MFCNERCINQWDGAKRRTLVYAIKIASVKVHHQPWPQVASCDVFFLIGDINSLIEMVAV